MIAGCGAVEAPSSHQTDDALAFTDLPPQVVRDHLHQHPGSDPTQPCTCETDKARGGWCWHCNVGYLAGHKIESPGLFEALDSHGHDVDIQLLQPICPDAIEHDGWCDTGGMGFVARKAYFTRLTYGLARGVPANVARFACPLCRAHGGDEPGWCDHCGRGVVGNVVFSDRALFERTAQEYRNMLAAIERNKVCDMCALAMIAHTWCPHCKISYRWSPQPS